jgi:hypothetical protein
VHQLVNKNGDNIKTLHGTTVKIISHFFIPKNRSSTLFSRILTSLLIERQHFTSEEKALKPATSDSHSGIAEDSILLEC